MLINTRRKKTLWTFIAWFWVLKIIYLYWLTITTKIPCQFDVWIVLIHGLYIPFTYLVETSKLSLKYEQIYETRNFSWLFHSHKMHLLALLFFFYRPKQQISLRFNIPAAWLIKRWGAWISPGYYECGPWLLSRENRRKIEIRGIASNWPGILQLLLIFFSFTLLVFPMILVEGSRQTRTIVLLLIVSFLHNHSFCNRVQARNILGSLPTFLPI